MVSLVEVYFSTASIKWPLKVRVALYLVNLGNEDDSSDSLSFFVQEFEKVTILNSFSSEFQYFETHCTFKKIGPVIFFSLHRNM